MRKYLIAFAWLWLGFPALAADMPVKARAVPVALPLFYGGSGFYYGMGVGTERTKIGTATVAARETNIYAAGGLASLTAGYTMAVGVDRWAAAELTVSGANTDASAPCAGAAICSVERKRSLDLTAMYGAPSTILSGILGSSPVTFPTLESAPNGDINRSVHPFLLAGVRCGQVTNTVDLVAVPGIVALEEKHNRCRGKVGTGVMVQMTNSSVWRSTVDWTPGGSHSAGIGGLFVAPDGATLRAMTGMYYSF